jgi:hypothetical protein
LELISSVEIEEVTGMLLTDRVDHRGHILQATLSISLTSVGSEEISGKGRSVDVVGADDRDSNEVILVYVGGPQEEEHTDDNNKHSHNNIMRSLFRKRLSGKTLHEKYQHEVE